MELQKITTTIIQHQQGSDEWLRHRSRSFNASELAAVMGLSPYKSRMDFVAERATGIVPEVDAVTQKRFDRGHEYESTARVWAEEILGTDLFPVVLAADIDGLPLSASLDGLTMEKDVTWEHKTGHADLLASLESGTIPPKYHPQLEQGLMLSGAKRCMFMASSGDREVMRYAWYESNPELRAKIIPTWKQFAEDLKAYVPPAASAIEKIVAEPVEALPAPVVKVTGQIALVDNFKAFEERLRDFLANKLIREPKTDEDFVNLDAQIKAMKSAREALKSAEAQMLAQVEPVDQAKKTKDMLDKVLQQNVSMAEKIMDDEKDRRKGAIVAVGVKGLADHIASLNQRLGKPYMPPIPADFGGAIKGLKSLSSMEDKVATELARVKIEANAVADRIQLNLTWLRENATEYIDLFADTATLVLKAPEDFKAVAENRISTEKQRVQAAHDKIREEAAEKARNDMIAAQAARAAQETIATAAQTATPAIQAAMQEQVKTGTTMLTTQMVAGAPVVRHVPAAEVIDEKPTLKLGEIGARLGFEGCPLNLTADFLDKLGFTATVERNAKLFKESDYPRICEALIQHITQMADLQAA